MGGFAVIISDCFIVHQLESLLEKNKEKDIGNLVEEVESHFLISGLQPAHHAFIKVYSKPFPQMTAVCSVNEQTILGLRIREHLAKCFEQLFKV